MSELSDYYYLINIVNIKIMSLNFLSKTTRCPFKYSLMCKYEINSSASGCFGLLEDKGICRVNYSRSRNDSLTSLFSFFRYQKRTKHA